MKTFFTWIIIQCVFARLMVGMTLGLWAGMNIGPEYLGYFVAPATLICLVEAVTSAMVVYPLVTGNIRRG